MNRQADDQQQMEALARWRNGQRDGYCGEVATMLLAAIALALCILGITMGWI